MVEWFRRFGDIPGIIYTTPPTSTPGPSRGTARNPRPSHSKWTANAANPSIGPYGDMVGSSSPAHSRAFRSDPDASSSEVIQNCCEGLELPGEPSNYHFLIQHTGTELWRRRREEPR